MTCLGAVDCRNCEWGNPVVNTDTSCLQMLSVVMSMEVVFYVVFDDGGSFMCGTIRVLGIVYGVIRYTDGTFRSEVSFRDQHYAHILEAWVSFDFICVEQVRLRSTVLYVAG